MKRIVFGLLLFAGVAHAQTQTPIFTPPAGTYAMPLPSTVISTPSPDASAAVSACYRTSTSCVPGSTGTAITCPASGSCTVNVNPSATVEICADSTATGKTVSSITCALFTKASGGIATGDSRTVVEPVFPTGCTIFHATKYQVQTRTVNIDPLNVGAGSAAGGTGTQGTLGATGGYSLEPSSTASPTYTAAETTDNTAWQAAVNAAAGTSSATGCLELEPGTSGQTAIVLAHWTMPSYLWVVVDAGTEIDGSRNPGDYNSSSGHCGYIPTSALGATSCYYHFITSATSPITGSGIIGYGVINGRLWDQFTTTTPCGGITSFCGFGFNRVYSYCATHGGTWSGITCPGSTGGDTSDIAYGPDLVHLKNANNFTMYKTSFIDPGNFDIYWGDGGDGLTAWGIKVMAPFEVSNSDGFDPSYSVSDVTLANSFISNGDNHIAIKSDSGSSYTGGITKNISILNLQTGAGIGVTIGYDSGGGVSNVLVNGLVQNGNQNNASQQVGHGINSPNGQGGAVNLVTYENTCVTNETKALLYSQSAGQMTNIVEMNTHILNGSVSGTSGSMSLKGISGDIAGFTLTNVTADGSVSGSSYQYATVGGTNVSFSSGISGTGVTNTITNPGGNTPYPCTTSTWQPLIGELLLATSTQNNLQRYTTAASTASYTLQAVIRPATEVNVKESAVMGTTINFYDNGTLLGSGTIGSNGTLATYSVLAGSGTHVYTAKYPADSYYPLYTFGNLVATIGTGSTNSQSLSPFVVGP